MCLSASRDIWIPSALVHLLTIESFALYASTYGGAEVWNKTLAWWRSYLESANLPGIRGSFVFPSKVPDYILFLRDCWNACEEFELGLAKRPLIIMEMIAALLLPTCALSLLGLSIMAYIQGGCPRSFGQGSYLSLTWHLEKMRSYKILVVCLSISPVVIVCVSILLIPILSGRRHWLDGLVSFLSHSLFVDFAVFLFSVKQMIFPSMPALHWDPDRIHDVIFKRTFLDLFTQSNDQFGIILTHALYSAEHGHPQFIKNLLPENVDYNDILAKCAKAEENNETDDHVFSGAARALLSKASETSP